MYTIRYEGMKPVNGNHSRAIVDSGDGWFIVDPMRFERYPKKEQPRRQATAPTRNKVFQPAKPQRATRKQTVHSRRKFMSASIMADPIDSSQPTAGELIQPLRGREWVSEFWVPLAQASITGILAAAGTGIILAVSHELLNTVRAGVLEFSIIGGSVWAWNITRHLRHYEFIDAATESLPLGVLAGTGTAVYYLIVTGSWFTLGWGAAIAGAVGFFGLSAQWGGFLSRADDLLYAIERMMAVDIDGDGTVGEPPIEPGGVRVMTIKNGEKEKDIELKNPLPVDSRVFQAFAIAVMCEKCTISKAAITKLTNQKDWKWRKISQPAYSAIYNYCQKNGYIETGGNNETNELSVKGWDELSRWIPANYTPNLHRPTPA